MLPSCAGSPFVQADGLPGRPQEKGSDTLREVAVSDPANPAAARVTAACTVLDFARQHVETAEIEERLAALESLQGVSDEPGRAPGPPGASSRKRCAGIPIPESSRWRSAPLTLAQWARLAELARQGQEVTPRAPSALAPAC